jgi:hypothetical protein
MDDQDEACENGLHIVIGHLDRQQPDMSVSFVASGTRFILRLEDAVEGFTTPRPPPSQWLQQVQCCEADNTPTLWANNTPREPQ